MDRQVSGKIKYEISIKHNRRTTFWPGAVKMHPLIMHAQAGKGQITISR